MRARRIAAFFLALAAAMLSAQTAAAAPLERTDPHVIDAANLLTGNEESDLRSELKGFQAEFGVEVVLVTIGALSAYGGPAAPTDADVTRFAATLLRDWRVGGAHDNGVLILIAKNNRKMRIQLGDHYGRRHDGKMQGIVDGMTAQFGDNQFARGIFGGVAEVIAHFTPRTGAFGSIPPIFTVLGLIALLLLGPLVLAQFAGSNRDKCPRCGERSLRAHTEPAEQPGMSRTTLVCIKCDHRESSLMATYLAQRKRSLTTYGVRGLGGGRGGGGGGRGGGGASGGW